MSPRTVICAGGGGVGKTSTSASLALAAARRGQRVLVVTIDPARRLADALGVALGPEVQAVEGEDALFALMPDPRQAMRTFVQFLFAKRPRALERVLDNRMYQVMEDAVPGVHELAAMSLVTNALAQQPFDLLVIDTAPSRNAVDFITYPQRLAELLSGRAVRWLAQLAPKAPGEGPEVEEEDMKPKGRVMKLLERGLGPAIRDVGALSAELVGVMDRFVALNRGSSQLLLGGDTRYILVAAPTQAAQDDARFLHKRLRELSIRPYAIIVNGTAETVPPYEQLLRDHEGLTAPLRKALDLLDEERAERTRATDAAVKALGKLERRIEPLCLPHLGTVPPEHVVDGLAEALGPHLTHLLE